jgi:hypothetical protein
MLRARWRAAQASSAMRLGNASPDWVNQLRGSEEYASQLRDYDNVPDSLIGSSQSD